LRSWNPGGGKGREHMLGQNLPLNLQDTVDRISDRPRPEATPPAG
jgi:hypothetical protein